MCEKKNERTRVTSRNMVLTPQPQRQTFPYARTRSAKTQQALAKRGIPELRVPLQPGMQGLAEPSGRIGCLIPGTRQDAWTLEASYCRVYYAANKAANGWFPNLPGSESYAYSDIAGVLKKYSQEVKAGRCPEYVVNPEAPVAYPADKEAVIRLIAQRTPEFSGRYQDAEAFVRVVFWHVMALYDDDNSAIRPDVIWPRTVDASNPRDPALARYFKTYEDQLERQKSDNFLNPINDLLTNVMYVAIGIGAIYLLGPMIFRGK